MCFGWLWLFSWLIKIGRWEFGCLLGLFGILLRLDKNEKKKKMACLVNLKGGISISYLLFIGINYYVYELNLSNEPLVANWDIYSIKSGGKLGSRSTMSKAQAKSSFIFFS